MLRTVRKENGLRLNQRLFAVDRIGSRPQEHYCQRCRRHVLRRIDRMVDSTRGRRIYNDGWPIGGFDGHNDQARVQTLSDVDFVATHYDLCGADFASPAKKISRKLNSQVAQPCKNVNRRVASLLARTPTSNTCAQVDHAQYHDRVFLRERRRTSFLAPMSQPAASSTSRALWRSSFGDTPQTATARCSADEPFWDDGQRSRGRKVSGEAERRQILRDRRHND